MRTGMFLTYVYTYALLSWVPQGPLYTYTYELVSRGALRTGCGHFLRAAKGMVSLVLPERPAYTYARTRTLSPMVLHVHVRTPPEGASSSLRVLTHSGLPGRRAELSPFRSCRRHRSGYRTTLVWLKKMFAKRQGEPSSQECYFYGMVYVVRGTLVALVPVVFAGDSMACC